MSVCSIYTFLSALVCWSGYKFAKKKVLMVFMFIISFIFSLSFWFSLNISSITNFIRLSINDFLFPCLSLFSNFLFPYIFIILSILTFSFHIFSILTSMSFATLRYCHPCWYYGWGTLELVKFYLFAMPYPCINDHIKVLRIGMNSNLLLFSKLKLFCVKDMPTKKYIFAIQRDNIYL